MLLFRMSNSRKQKDPEFCRPPDVAQPGFSGVFSPASQPNERILSLQIEFAARQQNANVDRKTSYKCWPKSRAIKMQESSSATGICRILSASPATVFAVRFGRLR